MHTEYEGKMKREMCLFMNETLTISVWFTLEQFNKVLSHRVKQELMSKKNRLMVKKEKRVQKLQEVIKYYEEKKKHTEYATVL